MFRRQDLATEPAFGLQAAEFGHGAMEEAMSFGAGAIDGLLGFVEQGVEFAFADGHHRSFNGGTTSHAPGSMNDFGGQSFFDGACGREVCAEVGTELRVEIVLVGANEVAAGVESVGDGIAGDARAAFSSTGTAGGLRISAIGGDLSFSRHGMAFGEQRLPGLRSRTRLGIPVVLLVKR